MEDKKIKISLNAIMIATIVVLIIGGAIFIIQQRRNENTNLIKDEAMSKTENITNESADNKYADNLTSSKNNNVLNETEFTPSAGYNYKVYWENDEQLGIGLATYNLSDDNIINGSFDIYLESDVPDGYIESNSDEYIKSSVKYVKKFMYQKPYEVNGKKTNFELFVIKKDTNQKLDDFVVVFNDEKYSGKPHYQIIKPTEDTTYLPENNDTEMDIVVFDNLVVASASGTGEGLNEDTGIHSDRQSFTVLNSKSISELPKLDINNIVYKDANGNLSTVSDSPEFAKLVSLNWKDMKKQYNGLYECWLEFNYNIGTTNVRAVDEKCSEWIKQHDIYYKIGNNMHLLVKYIND